MRTSLLALPLIAAVSLAAHAGPPSKTLERAVKLYDKEDFFSASVELSKVMAGETADAAENVRRAEWFQAKTFARLEFHAAAQQMFRKIAEATPAHEYQVVAVKWLVDEMERTPTTDVRSILAGYPPGAANEPILDDATRAAFVYARGRHAGDHEDPDTEKILSYIPAGSRYWFPAQLEVAERRFKVQDLAAGIDFAARAGRDPATAMAAVRTLALWPRLLGKPTAARDALVGLSAGDTAAAGAARLEVSRLDLEAGAGPRALTPVASDAFAAVVLAAVCPTGSTDDAIGATLRTARAAATTIDELVRKYDDNAEIYEAVTRRIAAPADAADTVLRIALSDPDTAEVVGWTVELAHESDALLHTDRAWQTTMVAADILAEVTVQQSIAQVDAGRRIKDRLKTTTEQLHALIRALEPVQIRLAAGPEAGASGLIVTGVLCSAVLGTPAPATAPIAVSPPPSPPPRGHGCAGCAADRDPSAAALALAVVAIGFGRRRRRK